MNHPTLMKHNDLPLRVRLQFFNEVLQATQSRIDALRRRPVG
jgi:hypothetical protein